MRDANGTTDDAVPARHSAGTVGQLLAEMRDGAWMTWPNLLSVFRLLGVPVFLWLLLGPRADLLALLVLVLSGLTDWLDGKLARWLNQYSRLGELLDPAADRLYIIAILLGFVVRGVLPWWVAAVLIGRDLVLALCLPVLRYHGYEPPEVHYLGKAATFCLMYAFPLLLLVTADTDIALVDPLRPIAYAFTIWGAALYLWAGVLYLVQATAAIRLARARSR